MIQHILLIRTAETQKMDVPACHLPIQTEHPSNEKNPPFLPHSNVSLRGGGCGNSNIKVKDKSNPLLNSFKVKPLPAGFIPNLEVKLNTITSKAHLASDQGEKEEILIAIQWFIAMKGHINSLCSNASGVYDIIYRQLPELFNSAITLARISGFLCLQVLEIINDLSRVIFSFFMINDSRYLSIEYKENLLNLWNDLQTQLDIESTNIWTSGAEFEMEMIRAVIENAPSDSNEGQLLLISFIGGLAQSILTMSPSEELIQTLIAGAKFLHKMYQAKTLKQKYEIYYFFESLKWQIINALEQNQTQTDKILQLIRQAYKRHIESSTDWVLNFCWIKFVCFLIQYRPYLSKQDIKMQQWQEILQKKIIRPVSFDKSIAKVVLSEEILNNQIYKSIDKLGQVGIQQYNQLQDYLLNKIQFQEKKALIIKQDQQVVEQNKNYFHQFINEYFDTQEFDSLAAQCDDLQKLTQKLNQQYLDFSEQKVFETQKIQANNLRDSANEIIEMVNIVSINTKQGSKKLYLVLEKFKLIISQIDDEQENEDIKIIKRQHEGKAKELYQEFIEKCLSYNVKLQEENTIFIESILFFLYSFQSNRDLKQTILENFQKMNSYMLNLHNFRCSFSQIVKKIQEYKTQYSTSQVQKLKISQSNSTQNYLNMLIKIVNLNNIDIEFQNLFSINDKIISQDLSKFLEATVFFNQFAYVSCELQRQLLEQQTKVEKILVFLDSNAEDQKTNNIIQNQEDDLSIQKQKLKTIILNLLSGFKQAQKINISEETLRSTQNIQIRIQGLLAQQNNQETQVLLLKVKLLVQKLNYFQENPEQVKQFKDEMKFFINDENSSSQQKVEENQKTSPQNIKDNKVEQEQQKQEPQTIPEQAIQNQIDLKSLIMDQQKLLAQVIEKCKKIDKVAQENCELLKEAWEVEDMFQEDAPENKKQTVKELFQFTLCKQHTLLPDINFLKNLNLKLVDELNYKNLFANQRLSEQFIPFLGEIIQLSGISMQNSKEEQDMGQKLKEFFEDESYKVRECLVVNIFMIEAAKLESRVVQFCQTILLQVWTFERDERVRSLLKNTEYIEIQKQLFSHNLKSSANRLQEEMKQRLENMNNLEQKIKLEGNEESRQKMQQQLVEANLEFEEFIDNINDMTSKLDISLQFLREIKKDLSLIKQKIDKLQETLNNIGDDVRKLRGKTFTELLEIRKRKILDSKLYRDLNSIYIPLNVQEWDPILGKVKKDEKNKKSVEELNTKLLVDDLKDTENGEVNEFLVQKDKDVMLIRGLAGSGKSRAAMKIEEFLLEKQNTWTPIYVSLPTLKEPRFNLVDQAFMSEFYQFDKMQIKELKEALMNQKLKLIFILDSYDEMPLQCIQSNLYQTNRISQDLLGEELSKNNPKDFVKLIITTRSEILTSSTYQTQFYGESLKTLKEIELKGFDQKQQTDYFEQYSFLSVKKEIYDLYEFVQQATSQKINLQEFATFWEKIQKNIIEKNRILKQEEEDYVLTKEQVDDLMGMIQQENSFRNISKEQQLNLKKKLISLWSAKKYAKLIDIIQIQNILTTPFMMEIVVQVLPSMMLKFSDISIVKETFLINFSQLKEQQIKEKNLIEKYRKQSTQKFITNLEFLQKTNSSQELDFKKLALERWEKLEEINFLTNYSIEQEVQENNLQNIEDQDVVIRALQTKLLTVFDFYNGFTDFYHQRSIQKLKTQGKIIDSEVFIIDLLNFSQSLALDMTINQLTQTKYDAQGQLELKYILNAPSDEQAWKKYYFDDFSNGGYKKLIRSSILLTLKGSNYSFTHKSIQEYYVASYLLTYLSQVQKQENQHLYQLINKEDLYNQDKFNISSDMFKGVLYLMREKLKQFHDLKQFLVNIVKLTKTRKEYVRAASNSIYLLNFTNEDLQSEDLTDIYLNNTILQGMSFSCSNLENSIFDNVNISSTNFYGASLRNINWQNIECNELPYLEGHTDIIRALAFSPDGKILVSAAQDNTLRLWDFKAGQHITNLVGHTDCVLSIAFSPDGLTMATGGFDNLLIFWNIKAKKAQTIYQEQCVIYSVAFSPDGLQLAYGTEKAINFWDIKQEKPLTLSIDQPKSSSWISYSPDGLLIASAHCEKIEIWNIKDKKLIMNKKYTSYRTECVAFSPDGQTLGSCESNSVRLWDVRTGKQLYELEVHTSSVYQIIFSSDGLILASCSADNTIILWDVKAGKLLSVLEGHSELVHAIAFLPNGSILASGSRDTTIRLWDIKAVKQLSLLQGHADSAQDVAFSPDGQILASGGRDCIIKLWQMPEGKFIQNLEGQIGIIGSIDFSPNGQILVASCNQKSIRIWDVKTGKVLKQIKEDNGVNQVKFSSDGKIIALACTDYVVRLWYYQVDDKLKKLSREQHILTTVAFSNDSKFVATSGNQKKISIWDVSTEQKVATLSGHKESVDSITFSPDGKTLASCSRDKTIRLWDFKQQKEIMVLKAPDSVDSAAFATAEILASIVESQILIWDLQTGKVIQELMGHTGGLFNINYSPDKSILASCSVDITIRLWNFRNDKQTQILEAHMSTATSFTMSENDVLIAIGKTDNSIILWDKKLAKELYQMEGHQDIVLGICFSIDVQILASGSKDNNIIIWEVQSGKQMKMLEGHKSSVNAVAISPDNKTLVSAGKSIVLLWDILSGQQLYQYNCEEDQILCMTILSGGQILAYLNHEKNLKFFQIQSNAQKSIGKYSINLYTEEENRELYEEQYLQWQRKQQFQQQRGERVCYKIIGQRKSIEAYKCDISGAKMISQYQMNFTWFMEQKGKLESIL